MPNHREIELKYRLEGREHYERVCRELGMPESDERQVNHYFQSPDGGIPGERGVIRIRLERGAAVFTVKLGGPMRRGLVSSMEYEEPWRGALEEIPSAPESLWDGGFKGMEALEQAFGGRFPLVWAGSMENRRKTYRHSTGLRLEVDASRYSCGSEDFEVEVETEDPDRDRPLLEALLTGCGIRREPQPETKYQRFRRYATETRSSG